MRERGGWQRARRGVWGAGVGGGLRTGGRDPPAAGLPASRTPSVNLAHGVLLHARAHRRPGGGCVRTVSLTETGGCGPTAAAARAPTRRGGWRAEKSRQKKGPQWGTSSTGATCGRASSAALPPVLSGSRHLRPPLFLRPRPLRTPPCTSTPARAHLWGDARTPPTVTAVVVAVLFIFFSRRARAQRPLPATLRAHRPRPRPALPNHDGLHAAALPGRLL